MAAVIPIGDRTMNPKTMRNIMLDIETLGNVRGSVILSIGAVYFDKTGLGATFYEVVNRGSCLDVGMVEQESTLKWWSEQPPEALGAVAPAFVGGMPIKEALNKFSRFVQLGDKSCVWGCGSDFDNMLLQDAYEMCGISVPWPFYRNRCYRTLKNVVKNVHKPERTGVHHHALDDAEYQAQHAIKLLATVDS